MTYTADSSQLSVDAGFSVDSSGGGAAAGYAKAGGGTGGRSKRQGAIPLYWWQACYSELREIPLPQEPESNEVAQEVLTRLQALWRDLDEREVKFRRMMAEVERLEKLTAQFIESFRVGELLRETKQRIEAAEDARKARSEAEDLNDLMVIA